MSDTSSIIKVTDLVQKSLDALSAANQATDPQTASRHMQSARIFADLSESQGVKTANIIAYLNSDRSKWSETDEKVVRVMLGLSSLDGEEGDGGQETLDIDLGPAPSAVTEPEVAAAPEPISDPEPAVAPEPEEPVFA